MSSQDTNFEDASTNFGRAMAVCDLIHLEAKDALEADDYDEITLCRESLLETISNLERKLATVFQIAEAENTLPVGTIVHWRKEQKKQLSNMKQTSKQLIQRSNEAQIIAEQQEIGRRRAFEDQEREREDLCRERELQWIRKKNDMQQCQVGTITPSAGNAESSLNNVASPDYSE